MHPQGLLDQPGNTAAEGGRPGGGDIVADGFNASRPFARAIGDPANPNGAIPVGSVHPSRDKGKSLDALYGARSGTSMAAPRISGLLAAFLSVGICGQLGGC